MFKSALEKLRATKEAEENPNRITLEDREAAAKAGVGLFEWLMTKDKQAYDTRRAELETKMKPLLEEVNTSYLGSSGVIIVEGEPSHADPAIHLVWGKDDKEAESIREAVRGGKDIYSSHSGIRIFSPFSTLRSFKPSSSLLADRTVKIEGDASAMESLRFRVFPSGTFTLDDKNLRQQSEGAVLRILRAPDATHYVPTAPTYRVPGGNYSRHNLSGPPE